VTTRKKIPPQALCGCITDAFPGNMPAILRSTAVDLLEWRLDAAIRFRSLEAALECIPLLSDLNRLPVVVTNRPVRSGGHFSGSEEMRMEVLQRTVEAGAEWVDMEEGDSETTVRAFQKIGTRVLLSSHDFPTPLQGPNCKVWRNGWPAREPTPSKSSPWPGLPGTAFGSSN